jgi:Flavodoxins
MKTIVIYSSLSGKTKRLAEGIFNGIQATGNEVTISPIEQVESLEEYEIILIGYWVDKGGPDNKTKELLAKIKGKHIGLFATLGYYADSNHGWNAIQSGLEMVKEENTVIGSYVCNGALSEALINRFRQAKDGHHASTPQSEARWEIMKNHPTEEEISCAAQRFCERIQLVRKLTDMGESVPNIL